MVGIELVIAIGALLWGVGALAWGAWTLVDIYRQVRRERANRDYFRRHFGQD